MPVEVSIITPLYNCSRFISETIKSVLEQTYSDWELILVDDCSTDNSLEVAQQFAEKDSRIKIISLDENSGAAVARNMAIELANARYIAFLDSDDRWRPEKLERQIEFMKEKKIDFCYAAYEKLSQDGKIVGHVRVPNRVSYIDLLKVCSIGCLTAVYDTVNLGKVYMPLIRKRQDLGLWLRILKKIDYAYGISDPLAYYQLRDDSISANKKLAAQYTWRLYRDIERLNIFVAAYYFCFYAVNGVLRTKVPWLARKIGIL
ncbi:MAG: glycosyltransferase family 2 protein [Ottowia sp.]|nr:glycosyltransferase family 2 protein [Ottowia sp.]